jgi:hypothetical protein
VSGILQRKCACGQHTIAGGECDGCSRKHPSLQRATRSSDSEGQGSVGVPQIVYEVLQSSGQPLDSATRAFFEPRFDHDFSQVRVHTDAKAAQSAQGIGAHAYTVGTHIVFGSMQYSPQSELGKRLFAHELTHTLQQQQRTESSRLEVVESPTHEQEADIAADAIRFDRAIPKVSAMDSGRVSRDKLDSDEIPKVERNFELDPQLFLRPMSAPAPKEVEKCEEFPGGSTDCEVDQKTGTPTGKVTHRIDEKNPCTRPCVEQHEAVHVKQLTTFCPQLRDCYLMADKGKRPVEECVKMAIFGMKERECAAYKVSVPCTEKRLKDAKECQSKENKDYGTRKLASEKCFRDKSCGA